ncbi:hypothetical protein [Agrobacterium pusense]|uniref:hypothetical protein n=1 Tax=Agrobacterium pusense TaxID=648995 RepID=UPI00384EEE96
MDVIGYTENGMVRAIIDGVELTVPDDMGNRHRQMIAVWEGAGNTIPPYVDPASLEDRKVTAAQQIDADAEAARLRYITGGSGQAMTYQQKAAEAAAALAATDPDPADYPLIVAEIGITAPTLLEVAAVIDGAYQQWRVVGAAIEALRLGGKAAVAAAMTVEDVQAAADITWP